MAWRTSAGFRRKLEPGLPLPVDIAAGDLLAVPLSGAYHASPASSDNAVVG